jgi:hypothetical protein
MLLLLSSRNVKTGTVAVIFVVIHIKEGENQGKIIIMSLCLCLV